jgi:hypothetical protein
MLRSMFMGSTVSTNGKSVQRTNPKRIARLTRVHASALVSEADIVTGC